MNKLSLDALKERADSVASQDLLNSISGGTENSCHTYADAVSQHAISEGEASYNMMMKLFGWLF